MEAKKQKEKKQKDNGYDTSKKTRRTFIGGQALLEGVMMRGKSSVAMAVRSPCGDIELDAKRLKPQSKVYKVPIVRGIVSFVSSLVVGMKSMLKSAEVSMPEDEAPSKGATVFSVILGVVLAVVLFVGLPWFSGWAIEEWAKLDETVMIVVKSITEGGVRLVLFIGYLALVRLMPDIKRTFMYHGAEHRTINCYERGLPLTVENVQSCSTKHNRCGTTFLFFVVIIAILFYALLNWLLTLPPEEYDFLFDNFFFTFALRLCLLPIIAGVSYELLRGLAMLPDNKFTNAIRAPGLVLQALTTALPDDEMAEVAIAAFNAVLELDEDPNKQPIDFYERDFPSERKKLKERLKADPQDADWIYSALLDKSRGELGSVSRIKVGLVKTADGYADRLEAGEPLDYILGASDFCGVKIKVDNRVLIPRFETEALAIAVAEMADEGKRVLDLCTGSGCISAYLARNTAAEIVAADISDGAIEVATGNLKGLGVAVVKSDMFENIDGKFDIIVSNPPYVRTREVDTLAPQVTAQPRLALDGGEDGLKFYRIIAENAETYLNENGVIAVEVGYDQAKYVSELFEKLGKCEIIKDLDGIDRIVVCRT